MLKTSKAKKNIVEKINVFNAFDILNDEDSIDENNIHNTIIDNVPEKIDINIENKIEDDKFVDNVSKIKTKYITPLLKKNNIEERQIMKKEPEKHISYYNDKLKTNGEDLKLNSLWKVWVHENNNEKWDIESYNLIYTIENIAQLWRFLNTFDNMDRINRQFYIMRDGIMPIWEDNNNKNGVICSIRCDNIMKNTITNSEFGVDVFSCFCIMVLNECFTKKNIDINGLCYSIKNRNILIKFWIKNYDENKNFTDKLPLQILNTIDDIIISLDSRKKNNKISVQVKQIQPEN